MNEVQSVKNGTSGFTLVELMVVVLLVALVALVSTQIPLFSVSSWRKGAERLRMQRDANLTMIKIQRELRPALSDVDVAVSEDPTKLVINSKVFVLEGDEGTKFFPATNTDGVWNISFILKRGNVQTTLRTVVKPRN